MSGERIWIRGGRSDGGEAVVGVVTSGEEVLDSESFPMILLHFLTMASFELVAGGECGCGKAVGKTECR